MATAHIDIEIETALRLRPDCRPGERIVAGKVHVYDSGLLVSFEARERVRSAPADLSGLTEDQLAFLASSAQRRRFDTKGAEGRDVQARALAEIEARKAAPQLMAAE